MSHRPRSLARRVLTGELIAVMAVALLLPVLLLSSLRAVARHEERAMLVEQARTVSAGLRPAGTGGAVTLVRNAADAPGFASSYDGRSYRVVDASGRIRLRSRYSGPVPWSALQRSAMTRYASANGFALLALPITFDGQSLWVEVAQDRSRPGAIVDDIERAFLPRLLMLVPVLMLVPLLSALAFRNTARALRSAADQAAAIVDHPSIAAMPAGHLPAEIRPLVAAINALLGRLKKAHARQGEFTGNIVHELRTPLQTLSLRIADLDDGIARDHCLTQVKRMRHVLAQLSDLATLDDIAAIARDQVDLTMVARDAVTRIAADAIASGHAIAFEQASAPVRVYGNAVLIDIAIANLITNAVKHTPPGCSIAIATNDDREIRIRDDGPGLPRPAAELRRRHEFLHLGMADGNGLGLAIVDRIMDFHDGEFQLLRVETGTEAVLTFR